jgi:hypothetical protein
VKKELIFELSVYVLCILLVAFLWHKPSSLMVCYIAITFVVLLKWHTKGDFLFYGVAFILGPFSLKTLPSEKNPRSKMKS